MNFFQDYALLLAVAIPVVALVGLNVFLWFGGERGTLVMPSSRSLTTLQPVEIAEAPARAVVEIKSDAAAPFPANDEYARAAA